MAALASRHGAGAARVQSCQRLEVFGLQACDCPAPLRLTGLAALRRLAEVGAGLHSLVLGEAQILGQVRSAVALASPELRAVAGAPIGAARQFRHEQQFQAHTGHLLDRALRMSRLGCDGTVAIVGAGVVGRLVAERAIELGFGEVTVLGRRPAAWVAHPLQFRPLEELRQLGGVDFLVTCLGGDAAPLTADDLPPVRRLVVDLGTPRNVEGDLRTAVVSVGSMLAENERDEVGSHRAALIARLHEILDWRLARAAETRESAVGRLRFEVERIRRLEVERAYRLHPEVRPETVDAITRSLLNHVFHLPTERLRAEGGGDFERQVAALFAARMEVTQ